MRADRCACASDSVCMCEFESDFGHEYVYMFWVYMFGRLCAYRCDSVCYVSVVSEGLYLLQFMHACMCVMCVRVCVWGGVWVFV